MKSHRIHQAARQNPTQLAKLVLVQEAQIAALTAELDQANAQVQVLEAVLLGVCERYVWDVVDPSTGEVTIGKSNGHRQRRYQKNTEELTANIRNRSGTN